MHFTFSIILSLLFSTLTSAITASYDTVYDDASQSLRSFACSDGENGLMSKNFTTQGQLPTFPAIGASHFVSGWNSTNCGSCWNLVYKEKSVKFLAIDHSAYGFVLSKSLMDKLTSGRAGQYGRIDVNATQLSDYSCGL